MDYNLILDMILYVLEKNDFDDRFDDIVYTLSHILIKLVYMSDRVILSKKITKINEILNKKMVKK